MMLNVGGGRQSSDHPCTSVGECVTCKGDGLRCHGDDLLCHGDGLRCHGCSGGRKLGVYVDQAYSCSNKESLLLCALVTVSVCESLYGIKVIIQTELLVQKKN